MCVSVAMMFTLQLRELKIQSVESAYDYIGVMSRMAFMRQISAKYFYYVHVRVCVCAIADQRSRFILFAYEIIIDGTRTMF